MINRKKYFYWLPENEEITNEEIVWRELYSRIGYIFHTLQMIEYNIINILAVEEVESKTNQTITNGGECAIKKITDKNFKKFSESKLTFGQLVEKIKKSVYLSELDLKLFKKVVRYRNFLAHECFKEKLLNYELETLDDVDKFVNELNDFEAVVVKLNETVKNIFIKYRKRPILGC